MKGSIHYRPDRNRWVLIWYDEKARKHRHIHRYEGKFMPCTAFKMEDGQVLFDKKGRPIPDKDKCQGYELARKLRATIQQRWQEAKKGHCKFRIEEFTKDGWTDTVEYYYRWIQNAIEPYRKPATIKAYKSYAKNWIEPFFTNHPVRLHEIELDTLYSLLRFIIEGLLRNSNLPSYKDLIINAHLENPDLTSPGLAKVLKEHYDYEASNSWIRRVIAEYKKGNKTQARKKPENVGKTALNIMSSFHAMMDYAYRSNRIPSVPPFPKLEDYNLKGRDYEYLTPEEFSRVFSNIPPEHQPIFLFIRLHYRRPGEACALYKTDYDPINDYFKIHRAISDRQLVDSVKTNWRKTKVHRIDCDPDFKPFAQRLIRENQDSPFMFVNPNARKEDKRYTLESVKNIWYRACDKAGIRRIWPYRGLKHSACMEYVENGGSEDGLMIMTDHASRDSVRAYFEITLRRKRLAREEAKKRSEAAMAKNEEAYQSCQNVANVIPFKPKNK